MTEQSDRLRQARMAAGFDGPQEAAERFHWNVNTYKSNENGNAPFSFKRAKAYAAKFGVNVQWLYDGTGAMDAPEEPKEELRPATHLVPVLGLVQAGLWQRVMPDEPEPSDFLPVNMPDFKGTQLVAFTVSGPSMNLIYPEGTQVIVCPAADIGIRDGDHVVVRRHSVEGVELTLKEIVQEDGAVALWPRSKDPAFQEPLRIVRNHDADEGPEIVGVVVAIYAVLPARNRPLIKI